MYQERDRNRPRQPISLESLYITVQNACSNLQNTLDGICKQCDSLQIESRDEHTTEVLQRLDTLEGEVQLAMLSDGQCQLLVEDLDLNLSESTVIDIVKELRDLELLRKNVSAFFKKLNKRFSSILDDGVYLYCVSLIEIIHEEICEVIEYDKFISNQKLEISQALEEIHHLKERWRNLTLDLHSTIDNLDGLQACLTDVQARWKESKEKIFAWLKQDRDYPNRITNRISSSKDSIQCLLLEMDAIDESQKQREEECRLRQKQIISLQRKRRELYNNLGLVQRAKRYNTSKMSANESKSAQEIGGDKKPDSKKSSGESNSQNEFHRRRDARLDKEQSDVKASIANVDKKIDELKKFVEEEESKKDTSLKRINEIHTEIAAMEKANADCDVSFEEACRFVAHRVRHEWPRLYLHLPMWPIRSHAQRLEDINGLLGYERMNVVLPRNRTPIDDAAAALAKWRLLSRRYIDVEGLVTGLRKAGWLKLASEARKRFFEEVPQDEQELNEKCEQKIVTENEAVPMEEPEDSKDVNGQLNEISAYEEASKEIEEVSSTESKGGKVKQEVEKGNREDNGSQENEEESVDSEGDTEANGNDEIECDKSEVMHDNHENQECPTDCEGDRDESYDESSKANSVNGDLLEETILKEEAEKKDDIGGEFQETELTEMNGKSKSSDISKSAEREQKESTSTKSIRKSSVSSNSSKEEDEHKKKDAEYEISNSLAKNTSECEIAKDDNVVNQQESGSENESGASETEKKENSKLEHGSTESVSLATSKKFQESSPNNLAKDKDDSDIREEKMEQGPKKDSMTEIIHSSSEEEDDSENNSPSTEPKRSDMITEPASAKFKNVASKNVPKNPKEVSEAKSEDGAKRKCTKSNKKSGKAGKNADEKMPESKTEKTKLKPKDTVLKTAGNNSKNKSNEGIKEERLKSNHTSKSECEIKTEEHDAVIEKKSNKVEDSQERGVEKEITNKDIPKDAEFKLSKGDCGSEETGSGECENEDKITDDDGGREVEEPNNKEEDSKSKENVKETEKPPSKEKSSKKEVDKKNARKWKADKSGNSLNMLIMDLGSSGNPRFLGVKVICQLFFKLALRLDTVSDGSSPFPPEGHTGACWLGVYSYSVKMFRQALVSGTQSIFCNSFESRPVGYVGGCRCPLFLLCLGFKYITGISGSESSCLVTSLQDFTEESAEVVVRPDKDYFPLWSFVSGFS
nr:hypothetical protein HmN_000398200 [Hymenolepis microstoma]